MNTMNIIIFILIGMVIGSVITFIVTNIIYNKKLDFANFIIADFEKRNNRAYKTIFKQESEKKELRELAVFWFNSYNFLSDRYCKINKKRI